MRTYKLCSARGSLLGVIGVPDEIGDWIERRDVARAPYYPGLPVCVHWRDADIIDIKSVTIVRSHHRPGAVEIHGMSLEEVEQMPGFSFAPSAAYLRSMIE